MDASGNLYIADTFNGRIRRVGADGTISTAAGVGSTGVYSGDGGPANLAGISLPTDVAVDRSGNLYIADFGNGRVRVVTNGIITTAAGRNDGAPLMEGEAAVNVRLEGPTGVTVDPSGSTIYFVQAGIGSGTGLAVGNYKVWKVSAAGILTHFCGNRFSQLFRRRRRGDSGAAQRAGGRGGERVRGSCTLRIRRISAFVRFRRAAQSLRWRAQERPGSMARSYCRARRSSTFRTGSRRMRWATGMSRTRRTTACARCSRAATCSPSRAMETRATSATAGPATMGSVNQPQGVAVDAAGNVYIADTLNHAVRKVTPDGMINTLAGTGNPGYSGDGGPANKARLSLPSAVAVDANGNVYVADTGNNQVRRIDSLGTITTVDTGGALNGPRGVAVDRAGNVYIADTGNRRVRRVSPGAPVTTIAGNGACCYSGDGGLALNAMLNQPWAVAVDAGGNVYVADAANNSVRMLAPVSAGITVSAVTNAASNLPGAVAPGELVVLYGAGLGAVRTVLFNGVAGPLLYAAPGQVGAVVPYAVGGGPVQVVVQSCGRGVGAGDGGVGADRARAIHGGRLGRGTGRGSESGRDAERDGAIRQRRVRCLSLYATGEGQTMPAGVDGKLGAAPLPQPVAPVTVRIGGVAAEVRFAGGAAGQIAGVMQVNVVVPAGLAGAVPVVLTVGGVAKPGGRYGGGAVGIGLTGHKRRWPAYGATGFGCQRT